MAIFTRTDGSAPWTRLRLGDIWNNANIGGDLRRLYVNATHFSDFTPGYEAAPLPVELASFKAARTSTGVQLLWSTAVEKNANHFEIQRSNTSNEFTPIGSVLAIGNSSTIRNYTFLDAGSKGGSYYRLKMIDNDNTYKYSEAVYVSPDQNQRTFEVNPNPVISNVRFVLSGWDINHQVNASLIAADGKVQWQAVGTPSALEAAFNSHVPNLAKGIYHIRLSDELGAQNVKIVKQ